MNSVLSLSLSRDLCDRTSYAFSRHKKYAEHLKMLVVLVFTTEKHKAIRDGNLVVIPTNSSHILSGLVDFMRISSRICRDHAIDVVTSQDPFFVGLAGLLISKGRPFRPQLHTQAFSSKYWRSSSWLNRIQHLVGSFVIRRCDKIRVVNPQELNFMRSKGIDSELIPIATSENQFFPEKCDKDIDLLFVGRFVHAKNISFLLDVIRVIKSKNPDIKVVFIGKGTIAVEEEVAEFGLRDIVRIVSFVDHSRLRSYYNRSRLLVLPSLYEGWGLVAVEASLCECPVIMSNTGCAGEIVIDGHSGFVCDVNDKDCFVSRVQDYLSDEHLRSSHGKNARVECLRKLDDNDMMQKWVGFLNG